MGALTCLVPAPADSRSGGSIYDRRVAAGLAGLGWRVDVRAVSGRFPRPGALERQRVGAALADLPDDATVLVDGLVFGAVPEIAEREEIGRAHV